MAGLVLATGTPSPTPTATTEPTAEPTTATTCDPWAGMVAAESEGCALRVTLDAGWLEVAVLAVVLVVGALFALVALSVRR